MKFSLLATAALVAQVTASTLMEPSIEVKGFSKNWKAEQRVSDSDSVDLYVVLKHNKANVEKLHNTLMDVSTPSSPLYGQHLSIEEVQEILDVNSNSTKFVTEHFEEAGATVSPNSYGDILRIQMPAQRAEDYLETELFHFRHEKAPLSSSETLIRAGSAYSLPDCLADKVSFVENLLRFPKLSWTPLVSEDEGEIGDDEFSSCGTKCTGKTTPAVLQNRYGYPTINAADVAPGNRMAGERASERSERAWWKTRLTLLFSILYFIFDGSGRIPDAVLRQRRHGCLH